ncbi:MAG: NUDIX domain-containing protein, partial [Candidatus Norongarragalinales archaeon]
MKKNATQKERVLRKGVAAVVFKGTGSRKRFLLLHRTLNWRGWEFPKGGIEGRESAARALKRELAEETGIQARDVEYVKPTRLRLEFESKENESRKKKFYSNKVFLVKVRPRARVRLGRFPVKEHDSFKWAPKKTALK